MNRSRGLVIGIILTGIMVLVVYLFSGGDAGYDAPPQFVSDQWEQAFVLESKNPQGLLLFKQLADSRAKRTSVLTDSLPERPEAATTYIFAGDKFGLHNREFDTLLKSVKDKGSDLFLSYHELMDNIWPRFYKDNRFYWHFDDEITVFTDNRSYRMYPLFQTDTISVIWRLIDPEKIIDTSFVPLSSAMESPNFIRLKLGKGNIYLHSNPELFFNYQLLTRTGFRHAQFAVSHINPKHKLKWLELGRLSENFGNSDTAQMEGEGGQEDNSLLQLLFSRKELLIALLLTILGVLLYLVFRTKRYWPQVPYLPPVKNRSLDFADTMTSIYFDQQSPYSILIVMRKNFRSNVSRHFFLDISRQENAHEIRLLSEKSGIDRQKVEKLVTMLENVKMQAVTQEYVQEAARRQREFYLSTGIIKDKVQQRSAQKKIELKRQVIVSGSLIFFGANAIIRGFYMLSLSKGWGVLFWPLGLLMLVAGIYLLSRRLIVVEKNQLTWYPYFGKKQTFDLGDVLEVKVHKGFTTMHFTGNRTIRISHFEISTHHRKDFSRLVAPYLDLH